MEHSKGTSHNERKKYHPLLCHAFNRDFVYFIIKPDTFVYTPRDVLFEVLLPIVCDSSLTE